MKTLLRIFIILITLAGSCSTIWAADVDLPPAIEKAIESRVMIRVSFFGFWESQGTGFVAAEGGYIITANHLFDRVPPAVALERVPIFVWVKNLDEEPIKAKFIARDPDKDLALIKTEESEKIGPPVKWAEIFPERGKEVYYSGFFVEASEFPFATFKAVIRDKLVSIVIEGQIISDVAILDCRIPMGFSGGPVFDLDGKLVGMNSFSSPTGGFGGIVLSSSIKSILKEIKN